MDRPVPIVCPSVPRPRWERVVRDRLARLHLPLRVVDLLRVPKSGATVGTRASNWVNGDVTFRRENLVRDDYFKEALLRERVEEVPRYKGRVP